MQLVFLTTNTGSKVRSETLEGEEYLVAPVTILREGVFEGNNGPLYYPADSLKINPDDWNHMPVVVYHPQKDGSSVSARDPHVIENRKVGLVFNATYDEVTSALNAEVWVNKKKATAVDKRIVDSLEAGVAIESSSGLFTSSDKKAGKYGDKPYNGTATGYRPDHLALLPDQKGACSVESGCGVLVTNEASLSNVTSQISRLLYKQKNYDYYVRDVYTKFFVYSDGNGKLYKQTYTQSKDGEVTIGTGDPAEVKWVQEYRTADDNIFVGNCAMADCKCKENNVDKKAHIDYLLTANCGWDAADRTTLESMPDVKVKGFYEAAHKAATPPPPPEKKEPTTNEKKDPPAPTVPDWRSLVPPETLAFIDEGVQVLQRERGALITKITTNANNKLSAEFLNRQKQDDLRAIADSLTPPAPTTNQTAGGYGYGYFAGAGGAPTTNAAADQAPLVAPSIFDKN